MGETAGGFAAELTGLIKDIAKSVAPGEHDAAEIWSQIAELGLVTIGIPEERGGSGGDFADLVVVIRELARAGLPTPIVEASTAAFALGVGSAAQIDTVAVAEHIQVGAAELSAELGLVPFAPVAARIAVIGGDAVAAVDVSGPGVEIDDTADIAELPAGRVRLDRARTAPAVAGPAVVLERLALARSAALLGCSYGAYELTREHLCGREQFGAPLIKIPAVSAGLAQMAVQIQQARAALDHAVALCAQDDSDALRRFGAVSSARAISASMATVIARSAHQLHGALGVTREYALHRYTTALWAWRDADVSERGWSTRLGAACRSSDERQLWDLLTV